MKAGIMGGSYAVKVSEASVGYPTLPPGKQRPAAHAVVFRQTPEWVTILPEHYQNTTRTLSFPGASKSWTRVRKTAE